MLDNLIKALIVIEKELSLPMLITLLMVRKSPGISVNELSEAIGLPQQTASRYVASLQGRYEDPNNNFHIAPLITIEINSEDPRRRALFITDEGIKRVTKIIKSLIG